MSGKLFHIYSLFCFLLFLFLTDASANFKNTFERNYDVLHIKLTLSFNEEQKSVDGIADIVLKPIVEEFISFKLHAKDLDIHSVKLNQDIPVNYNTDNEVILLNLPKAFSRNDTLKITIKYFAQPKSGLYFNQPNDSNSDMPFQIYSHSEPIDARCWFPCYDAPDDKFTSEIIATVPENYFLLSNGRLISISNNKKQKAKMFHWKQDKPHVSYLMSIVAGEYVEIRDNFEGLPVNYYVYQNQKDIAFNSFSKTKKMISFFQDKFGYTYPWDKYSQIVVADYQAGGMEHTSATTLHDRTIHDSRAHLDVTSDDLVSHELAHQWFGNLVTCKDWSHLWLNEGFATYSEILFKEFDEDSAEAQYGIHRDMQFYLEMVDPTFNHPIIYEDYYHPDELFNHIEYQKASLVLNMLRYVVGDSLFFKSLSTYLNRFEFQSVESADFIQVVEEITGQNLDWFFNEWLYHGGHPIFEIKSLWNPEEKKVTLIVKQTQHDSLGIVPDVFQMPVQIEIVGEYIRKKENVFLQSRADTFQFAFDSSPLLVRFDKNNVLIKEVQFIKSQDEWIFQLMNDENVAARLYAISQMEKVVFDTLKTIVALEDCLLSDPFWAVRKEAAYLLVNFHRPASKLKLVEACRDPHPKVRYAAIAALASFYDIQFNPLFRKIALSDSSYRVVSEALYALSNVPDDSSLFLFSKFVDMDSYNDVIRTAAFHGLRESRDKRAIPIAIKFAADPLTPEYRRTSAMSILKEIGIGNSAVEQLMITLLKDPNRYIKKKAIDILGSFKTAQSLESLKALQEEELPDDIRRRLNISIRKIERDLKSN